MNFSIKKNIAAIKDDRLQQIIISFCLVFALLSISIYGLLYPMKSGDGNTVFGGIGIVSAIVVLFIAVQSLLKFKANKDDTPQNQNIRFISRYGNYDEVCDEIDGEVNNPETFIMRQSEIIITKKWLIHDCPGYGVIPIPVQDIIWIEIRILFTSDLSGEVESLSYMKFISIKGSVLVSGEKSEYIINVSNWFRKNYPSVVQGYGEEYKKIWKKDAENFASYFTLPTYNGTVTQEWLRNDKVLAK